MDDVLKKKLESAVNGLKQKNWQGVIDILQEDIDANTQDLNTLNLYGFALFQAGSHIEGEKFIKQSLINKPKIPSLYNNYGSILLAGRRFSRARKLFQRAIAIDKNSAKAWHGLSLCHHHEHDKEKALFAAKNAFACKPDFEEAYLDLSLFLREKREFTEAEIVIREALNKFPLSSALLHRMASILCEQCKYKEVLELYESAQDRKDIPKDVLYTNFAVAHYHLGNLDEGIKYSKKSLAIAPNEPYTHFNLGLMLLAKGQYEQGWPEFAYRFKLKELMGSLSKFFPKLKTPFWHGESLKGKTLLIHHEQGLGDTILMLRYLKQLADLGGKVIIMVPESIARLFQGNEYGLSIIPMHHQIPYHDYHCPVMNIAWLMGTTRKNIPQKIPYIQVPSRPVTAFHPRLLEKNKLHIGLVWKGGAKNPKNSIRNLPIETLECLSTLNGTAFYSLQIEAAEEHEMSVLQKLKAIQMHPIIKHSFLETACLMEHLDIVLTVDTATAHLAGALGKETWLIFYNGPDWRWDQQGLVSPWYPTVRIFRKEENKTWEDLLQEIKAALEERITKKLLEVA